MSLSTTQLIIQILYALIAVVIFTIVVGILGPNIQYWFRQLIPIERAKGGRPPKKQPTMIWFSFWISVIILLTYPLIDKQFKEAEKNSNLIATQTAEAVRTATAASIVEATQTAEAATVTIAVNQDLMPDLEYEFWDTSRTSDFHSRVGAGNFYTALHTPQVVSDNVGGKDNVYYLWLYVKNKSTNETNCITDIKFQGPEYIFTSDKKSIGLTVKVNEDFQKIFPGASIKVDTDEDKTAIIVGKKGDKLQAEGPVQFPIVLLFYEEKQSYEGKICSKDKEILAIPFGAFRYKKEGNLPATDYVKEQLSLQGIKFQLEAQASVKPGGADALSPIITTTIQVDVISLRPAEIPLEDNAGLDLDGTQMPNPSGTRDLTENSPGSDNSNPIPQDGMDTIYKLPMETQEP
ncbi:MAG: hypothetical protein L6R45_32535 [Anaerolineae bacterium]|nr:hypothetical protein [Anaerolineae bacterium]